MSAKAKSNPLNGVHTAGIYSDPSIDGPQIGTLVMVVDRAKNLPNRKTIGKQDPYCAARLGKEAKKTATDIRGGQTPRWDQELRFAVHDSPDYYQLKVSVFSDDKKTELIGETWVDLRDIIVSGGGQSDQWHSLSCRGKYAGEIRIEITFYDTRPKPEKQAPVAAPVSAIIPAAASVASVASAASASVASAASAASPSPLTHSALATMAGPSFAATASCAASVSGSSLSGPRAPRPLPDMNGTIRSSAVKRRPLPSDPVTGQAPAPAPALALPSGISSAVSTTLPAPALAPLAIPQPLPQPPPQLVSLPAAQPQTALPAQVAPVPPGIAQLPDAVQAPPRAQPNQMTPYTSQQQSPHPSVQYNTSPQPAVYQQMQQPPTVAAAAPTPLPALPPAPAPAPAPAPLTSSALALTPTSAPAPAPPGRYQEYQEYQGYPDYQDYNEADPFVQHHSRSQERLQERPQERPQPPAHYTNRDTQPAYDGRYEMGPIPVAGSPGTAPYEDVNNVPLLEDRPPPPPVHRSRNNSYGSTGVKGTPPQTIRHDVLRNEAHRYSMSSAYPGRPTYRPLESGSSPVFAPVDRNAYGALPEPTQYQLSQPPPQPSPPRHRASYEVMYDGQGQLFEEDGNTGIPPVPSPAPLNLGRRESSSAGSVAPSVSSTNYAPITPPAHRYADPSSYSMAVVPRTHVHSSSGYSAYEAVPEEQEQDYHDELESKQHDSELAGDLDALPDVPPSLVPGVDPGLALELRSRIQQEDRRSESARRYTIQQLPMQMMQQQQMEVPTRGRQMIEGPPTCQGGGGYGVGRSYETPPPPPPQSRQRYDRSPGRAYSTSPGAAPMSAGVSPSVRQTIKRKSISPAPPVQQSRPADGDSRQRRLSGIPFGPDSYDALNPSASVPGSEPVRKNFNETTGKIISYDGREVDPSDHLPIESWAPEPEAKTPKPSASSTGTTPETALTVSGRRQLRIAGRPQSMSVSGSGSSGITFSSGNDKPVTPTGRNRLQKKTARQSYTPGMSPADMGSSPLAPLAHPRPQDNFKPPTRMTRASTFDGTNENYAPGLYGSSPGGRSGYGGGSAPPIPAKVPVAVGGGVADGGRRNYTARDGSPVMSGALGAPLPGSRALPWSESNMSVVPVGRGMGMARDNVGAGGESALLEEMSRIDLGTGRGRRHQGRYY